MEFRELLYRARLGDQESIMEIFEMYRPLLVRNAYKFEYRKNKN